MRNPIRNIKIVIILRLAFWVYFINSFMVVCLFAQSSTNFKLKSGIFNIAGGRATSSNYKIHGTLGQAGGVSSGTNFRITTGIITAITFEEPNELSTLPVSFDLSQNFPNPFNPMTVINYSIRWDGRNKRGVKVSSGVYIYRIIAGDFIRSKKMVLLK